MALAVLVVLLLCAFVSLQVVMERERRAAMGEFQPPAAVRMNLEDDGGRHDLSNSDIVWRGTESP